MRIAPIVRGMAGSLAALAAVGGGAAEVRSEAPAAVAVTVYRSPSAGRFELNDLGGFALITETRRVSLPAGESTLRFEGVAGGIEAESAIVTGFDEGVIEKNRDARLLSPAALVAASVGRAVELERTHPRTGGTERVRGTIVSDADGGVVFQSASGVEALRCSGLPETFSFEAFAGANAVPTLSVRVHSAAPVTRKVTLSYLASGFDWSATYTATLSDDGTTMDLGAWVTLANGNGESFRDAQTQVVAGRLNHEARGAPPDAQAGPIIAQCWPRGSTSDVVAPPAAPMPPAESGSLMMMRSLASPAAAVMLADLTTIRAKKVEQEQLGDLKLYRVPERTTVAARQMKQVRLMDQPAVRVSQIFSADIGETPGLQDPDEEWAVPVTRKLRTRNDAANHLGLPLPSGSIAVFAPAQGASLLVSQSKLTDHAVDEEVEVELGPVPDVQVAASTERRTLDSQDAKLLPLLPGLALRSLAQRSERRIEVTNARAEDAEVELNLMVGDDARVVSADHPLRKKNGRFLFSLRVPAQGGTVLRYATAKTQDVLIRAR